MSKTVIVMLSLAFGALWSFIVGAFLLSPELFGFGFLLLVPPAIWLVKEEIG